MKYICLFLLTCSSSSCFADTNMIDIKKVYLSSPLIYSFLSILSVTSLAIWIYSLITFRSKNAVPRSFCDPLKDLLKSADYSSAQDLCEKKPGILSSLILTGLTTRNFGAAVMIDSMKSEGKRIATPLWQRLSLLNDIAMISPMIGLLGTVVGMFYAFYDINRSVESINTLFDGLGIAVGTTVAGLVVSILAMVFSTTLKYRLVKTLSRVENESISLSSLIQIKQGH